MAVLEGVRGYTYNTFCKEICKLKLKYYVIGMR